MNTMPVDISKIEKMESSSDYPKFDKAKTERQRRHNILAEEAAQIFDDKISAHQKVRFLMDRYLHIVFV